MKLPEPSLEKNGILSQLVKDKIGQTSNHETEQRRRWAEHFQKILNRALPSEITSIPKVKKELAINTNPPTMAEIIKVIYTKEKWKSSRTG